MCDSAETIIRRDDFVLVVIDVQMRLATTMSHRERVIGAATRLVRTAALVGAPVIVTRQYPDGLGPTEEDLEAALVQSAFEGATVLGVDKMTFCCGGAPEFVEALSATTRKQAVVVGMETHICVTQTTLDLIGRGMQVHVVADGCCSRDDHDHEIALRRMCAAGAIVTTSQAVMYEAVERAGTDEFKRLLAIVKG